MNDIKVQARSLRRGDLLDMGAQGIMSIAAVSAGATTPAGKVDVVLSDGYRRTWGARTIIRITRSSDHASASL